MKAGVVVRAFSAVEQGVISLTNFLVMVIVSRYGDAESVAQFSLLFGLYFLNTRIHFALIAMPLSIQSGKLDQDSREMLRQYIGYSFGLGLASIILTIPLLLILDALWLHLDTSFKVLVYMGGIIGLLPLIESVRRILILKNIKYAFVYSLFNGVILLSSVIYFLKISELTGAYVFIAYTPSVLFAIGYLFKINNFSVSFRSDFHNHCYRESALVFHSLLQWINGYAPIYVAASLLSANTVAFIVLLRNMFGPLNILLLSLESYMPRLFKLHYDLSGLKKLRNNLYREILLVLFLVTLVCVPLLVYKFEIFNYIYGFDKYITTGDYLFYIYYLIYMASFVSRIISIGLRVRDRSKLLAYGTGMGSLFLLASIVPFAKIFGGLGLLYAMLLSELVVATYFKRKFDEKAI